MKRKNMYCIFTALSELEIQLNDILRFRNVINSHLFLSSFTTILKFIDYIPMLTLIMLHSRSNGVRATLSFQAMWLCT